MSIKKVTVQNSKGHTLIVQPSQIPAGYKEVHSSKKKQASKSTKSEK
ncbi:MULTISPECIES: hypothetical protein [unclassified Oceanobacillus]|nr:MULTISPECIES: hypothetical protein [unclassified Oceanobacillus]MBT2599090.1 hypothetical protein [Oceanobacillus sp. ISL-74]MBT2652008.1 hypothetical protein [Oceanobacillus sp. ISL-73]